MRAVLDLAVHQARVLAEERGEDIFDCEEAERLFYDMATEMVAEKRLSNEVLPKNEDEKDRLRDWLMSLVCRDTRNRIEEEIASGLAEHMKIFDNEVRRIRNKYGSEMSDEEAIVISKVEQFIANGQGEWGTILDLDGVERPHVEFNIKDYPIVELAESPSECKALLSVIMQSDGKTVREFSLYHPDTDELEELDDDD